MTQKVPSVPAPLAPPVIRPPRYAILSHTWGDGEISFDDITHHHSKFGESRWFTRGWTLQELLAPKKVRFYSKDWKFLGTKADLKSLISSITRIPEEVLAGEECQPPARNIGELFSWASRQNTAVVVDIAYALLGLLDINMPLLYGEGGKAFVRLQEELLKRYDDESIFAWEAPPNDARVKPYFRLLSPSVAYFDASRRLLVPRIRTRLSNDNPIIQSSKGISICLPRVDSDPYSGIYLALLDSRIDGSNEEDLQPAIKIQHLVGNQYARVDVHHLHDVGLWRLATSGLLANLNSLSNCPMVFPAQPQPPKPVSGFILRKKQKKTAVLRYLSKLLTSTLKVGGLKSEKDISFTTSTIEYCGESPITPVSHHSEFSPFVLGYLKRVSLKRSSLKKNGCRDQFTL
ncbi:hypothetical protein B0H66DRAFT_615418 [Apodospora peruviana]|uniref:DUF8212 domain-containing protein n=1 Tax=Apodospora peruviana TaxID=516989 RepID=A0AAE0MA63_9PEZI|nr:hypothetical protein B0H66DRAFT_615418 [Apodospora peruviana]